MNRAVKITYDPETGGQVTDPHTGKVIPVAQATINISPNGAFLTLTLPQNFQADIKGQAVLHVADPASGQMKAVSSINYADGTVFTVRPMQ